MCLHFIKQQQQQQQQQKIEATRVERTTPYNMSNSIATLGFFNPRHLNTIQFVKHNEKKAILTHLNLITFNNTNNTIATTTTTTTKTTTATKE